MPRLIIAEGAVEGLERCRRFLEERNQGAAQRAGQAIARRLQQLRAMPELGRPFRGDAVLRELVIGFGGAGYVALYRYDQAADVVVVLAVRHQREAGY